MRGDDDPGTIIGRRPGGAQVPAAALAKEGLAATGTVLEAGFSLVNRRLRRFIVMSEVECQIPEFTPEDAEIKGILENNRIVAVVGLSTDPDKDSHRVARYLQEHGYQIVPVNPKADEILGEKCYGSLKEIPFSVDIVDIFRKIEAIPAIVDASLAIGAKVVWMQLGLAENRSARKAMAAGLQVVMNKCLKIEHSRYLCQ
jgi:predicted CoA-binding protein